MSAIAGIIGMPAQDDVLQRLLDAMARRGWESRDVFREKAAALLHTGSYSQQVQTWAGADRTLVLDGELYNTPQLRQTLQALGHSFRGVSQAEVLFHAYDQWGEAMLHQLNGVFALALWEAKPQRLFLARDPIGVKPLFYTQIQEALLFASQIGILLAHPDVPAQLDAAGAGELLLLGPGRTPGSGVLRNIQELEPGCYGLWEAGKLTVRRYWSLRDREHTHTFHETVETVRALVVDAVKQQMAPSMGAFLSGGLDSSLIASICARELAGRGERLQTFSVDYEDNDQYFQAGLFQPNADPEYIRTMQEYLGTEQHWTLLTPQALLAGLEEATLARDLPGMADVDISLHLFCRDVKAQVDVALSGECADEIFGGYPWYREESIRNFDGFPWAQTTNERTAFLCPWITEQIEPGFFVYDRYRQTLAECDILPGTDPVNTRIKQLVNLNFRWFMQTLLDRNDRMSASRGLTVRTPLCDWRIAQYLYSVPWEMKNWQGREKGLLREAMKDYLPEKVLYRKKSPFPKTHHPRYLALAEAALRLVLQDDTAPIFQLVPKDALESLLHQDFPWPWYGQLMRRPQTIVYMLQINFWLKRYQVQIV